MKMTLTLGALAATLVLAGCSSPAANETGTVAPTPLMKTLRIWPVGDSITAGASGSWKVWSPENGGYRRNLMLMLNDGYGYQFVGNTGDDPPGDDLPLAHSGYRGIGLDVFDKSECTAAAIAANRPDATLLLIGINSLGSKKEYPDTQGNYWSANGHQFNTFFTRERAFVDKVLANTPSTSVVFLAKLPPIGDTRFYQAATWDDTKAPGYDDGSHKLWTTVGDGSVNPKDIVPGFNTELQAFYDATYASEPRVKLVDLNTGMTVGTSWEDDVCAAGTPQNWWNGDALHPTQTGYRHLAQRWDQAIRAAFPTDQRLVYSVDCGAVEGTASLASEGAIVGSQQSLVWDKAYGPDPVTGKSWGHVGEANWGTNAGAAPADPALWFAWEGDTSVSNSIASATAGHDLVYRFEVSAGGTYRVFLGFHDTYGENSTPKATTRKADVFLDGRAQGTKTYQLGDYGREIYDVTNTTGTLEVKLVKNVGDPLLDSITVQRLY